MKPTNKPKQPHFDKKSFAIYQKSDKNTAKKPANKKLNDKPAKSADFDKKPLPKTQHQPTNELSIQEQSLFLLAEDLDNGAENPENPSEPSQNQGYQRNYCFIDGDEDISDFSKVNYVTVTRQQHDQRVDNFLLARLKGLPRSHIYNMIRSDEIRVNKKRCKPHDKLVRGDIVRIAPVRLATRERPVISQDFAQGLLTRIVYEDEGLIVINKPSGMAVHGGSGESFGVIEAIREATGKKYLELVHRIDKDTSGLLMIAKKRSTLKTIQDHLREKTLQKTYLCLVDGWINAETQTIDKPLLKFTLPSGERRVKVDLKSPDSKPSQTLITVLQKLEIAGKKASLIEAKPLTGRTHQIRVHLASIGHPLLGDDKYNPNMAKGDKSSIRRLCLHAYQLDIPEYEIIKVELPEDMQSLIEASNRGINDENRI